MSIQSRLTKLERAINPADGICPQGVVIRFYSDVTDQDRKMETVSDCDVCGLPPVARINLIFLPAKMTPEQWQAKYSKGVLL
jgi:hypothetical protein